MDYEYNNSSDEDIKPVIDSSDEDIKPPIIHMEEEDDFTPESPVIPVKSRESYVREYERFMEWMASEEQNEINEKVMLEYFHQMSTKYKASSLWCNYCKLQTMLRVEKGINLATFSKLHAFMKVHNRGIETRKSVGFTEDDLRKFFLQAPDDQFLFLKVVAICGIFGACRRHELCNLLMSDVTKEGSTYIISISPFKTGKCRKFVITDDSDIPYARMFEKYLSLRPEKMKHDRVLLKFSRGKCARAAVGKNFFGKCPSLIAQYLKLPNPSQYTGHAFRRTSVNLNASTGVLVTPDSHLQVGIVEKPSTTSSECITRRISGHGNNENGDPSVLDIHVFENEEAKEFNVGPSKFVITKNTNCTFNIYLHQNS